MLPLPSHAVALNPANSPLIDLLDSVLLRPQEVAKHWRLSESHLSNLRHTGKGIPFIKLESGAVRYRASEVIAHELGGTCGAITLDRITGALATMRGLPADQRDAIVAHLTAAFAKGE